MLQDKENLQNLSVLISVLFRLKIRPFLLKCMCLFCVCAHACARHSHVNACQVSLSIVCPYPLSHVHGPSDQYFDLIIVNAEDVTSCLWYKMAEVC